MNPLDFLEDEELLQFFHCQKTELSCIENPHIFLNQLRDHNLIPEDRYKKMSRIKSHNMKQALYEVLDWLEKERPQHIALFWESIFKDTIMNTYPTIRMLRNSLLDGSFHFGKKLPERVEKEETSGGKKKKLSEHEEEEGKDTNSGKKKLKKRRRSECGEEQASTSTQSTPGNRWSKKICFSPPLKKGEKSDVWTWPFYKSHLPVTCGKIEAFLYREKLAKGEKCVVYKKKWFTPGEFETVAGKQSHRNWKSSIRCSGTPLGKLIKEGHLMSGTFKGGRKQVQKSLFPPDALSSEDEDDNEESKSDQSASSIEIPSPVQEEEEEEEEEVENQTEQQQQQENSDSKKVFRVTCGALVGVLHEARFTSGICVKSIRTEMSWMTPAEFLEKALGFRGASWKRDIQYEGRPVNVLTEEDQENDDECFVCKTDKDREELVMCDQCPRSFHQSCHLPRVEDIVLGNGNLWMCTFCVFTSNKVCFYPDELHREEAMSRQISQHMLECQYLLLRLSSCDEGKLFANNPSLQLQDDSSGIQTPMRLNNVEDKLQQQLYATVGEFVSDVRLVFTDCAERNQEHPDCLAACDGLKKLFERELKNVFRICE